MVIRLLLQRIDSRAKKHFAAVFGVNLRIKYFHFLASPQVLPELKFYFRIEVSVVMGRIQNSSNLGLTLTFDFWFGFNRFSKFQIMSGLGLTSL